MNRIWNNCLLDGLPDENGSYLVIHYFMGNYLPISIASFANNLKEVDEQLEKKPGWYTYDDEYGYCESLFVRYWAELPELPEEVEKHIWLKGFRPV